MRAQWEGGDVEGSASPTSGLLSLCEESSGVCSKSEFVYRPLPCPYLPLSSTKDPGDMGTEGCSAGLVISAILCAHSTLNVNPKG